MEGLGLHADRHCWHVISRGRVGIITVSTLENGLVRIPGRNSAEPLALLEVCWGSRTFVAAEDDVVAHTIFILTHSCRCNLVCAGAS